MSKQTHQTGAALLILLLLALPAAQPLFSPLLTDGFDNVFHLWRAVQIDALLSDGVLFSRWAPQMAHGFGYPLFQFQAPLSAYVAALAHRLGLAWPVALNLIFALALVLSGVSMWLLGRALWGKLGGLISAAAYLYAPYHAYDIFNRGSLSAATAWVFAPLVLWGIWQWQTEDRRRGLGTAVLAQLALMLSHEPTAYAFYPLFFLWTVWHLPETVWQTAAGWRTTTSHFLPMLLGLASSAFFWLPALLERRYVQFERVADGWPFRYFDNFLPVSNLLALPRNADPSLLNDWPPRALGAVLLATAVLGLILTLRTKNQRRTAIVLSLALSGYSLMTLAISQPVWDWLTPLHAFTPWRFLAQASFCAALLSGGIVSGTRFRTSFKGYGQPVVASVAILILSISHFGWFYPRHVDAPGDTRLSGMVAWEQLSQTVGTTAKNELLPIWVERLPAPPAVPAWQDRLPADTLPPSARLITADYGPIRSKLTLETAEPFTAVFHALYFPGWRVRLNGMAVPVAPQPETGLLTFPVPAGQHTIDIVFGETPLRRAANLISLASLVGLLALTIPQWGSIRHRRDQERGTPPRMKIHRTCPELAEGLHRFFSALSARSAVNYLHWSQPSKTTIDKPDFAATAVLLIAALLVVGIKWGLVDRQLTPLRVSQLVSDSPVADQPVTAVFGQEITLLGWDNFTHQVPADEPLALKLYWQARQPLTADYRVGLTLLDANGLRWSEQGLRDYRWHRNPPPHTQWRPDSYVSTAYLVDGLAGTPPGDYRLQLSLFHRETLVPLTIFATDGQVIGPWLTLGTVTITPPRQPTQPNPQYPLDFVASGLTLWGSNVDRTAAAPGDPVLLTLFWSAAVQAETAVTLNLINNGETAAAWPITLPALPDGIWRAQLLHQLPVTLANGRYQWQLTTHSGQTIEWGDLNISAPERMMDAPEVATAVGATLDGQATLVGYTAEGVEVGRPFSVTLVWRGEQAIAQSYHVFVHLRDANGQLIAQSDGQPAGWARPTTGWLPGEYIIDQHQIPLPDPLPPGPYQLLVGLYLPGGSRLGDGIELELAP